MQNPIKTITLLLLTLYIMVSTGCDKDPEAPTFTQTCCTQPMTNTLTSDFSIYVPNAFSPNGDGTNDIFMIFGAATGSETMAVSIKDEEGTTIFSKTNVQFNKPSQGWDGKVNGAYKEGTFTYLVSDIVIDNVLQTGLSYEGTVYTLVGDPISCVENIIDCTYGTFFDGEGYSPNIPSGEICQ